MNCNNILIAVTGSIAAYKVCDLIVELKLKGFNCHVVMTKKAFEFVNKLTFEILSNNKVLTDDEWFSSSSVKHIEAIKNISHFLVVPATANTIGKIAHGIADNIVTTIAISLNHSIKKYFCPAMNTLMYTNYLVQQNISKLIACGFKEIKPQTMQLACGDYGIGGLADINEIIKTISNQV